MDWQRDPKTGEWVVIDPMTQSTSQAEPDPSRRDPLPSLPGGPEYSNPDLGAMPMSPDMAVQRTPEGAPIYHGSEVGPLRPGQVEGYQNYDYDIIDRWVREVQARGNEIRKTAAGTFEVEAGTNNIVSQMPSPYRVN